MSDAQHGCWLWQQKAIPVDANLHIAGLRKEIGALVKSGQLTPPFLSAPTDPPRVYGHPRSLSAVRSLYEPGSVVSVEGGFWVEGARWIVRWDLPDDVLVIVVPSGDPVGFMLGQTLGEEVP